MDRTGHTGREACKNRDGAVVYPVTVLCLGPKEYVMVPNLGPLPEAVVLLNVLQLCCVSTGTTVLRHSEILLPAS